MTASHRTKHSLRLLSRRHSANRPLLLVGRAGLGTSHKPQKTAVALIEASENNTLGDKTWK